MMKGKITIKFEEINGFKVNKELLEQSPKLLDITKNTMTKLCQTIEKYLKDYKIKTKVSFEIDDEKEKEESDKKDE